MNSGCKHHRYERDLEKNMSQGDFWIICILTNEVKSFGKTRYLVRKVDPPFLSCTDLPNLVQDFAYGYLIAGHDIWRGHIMGTPSKDM